MSRVVKKQVTLFSFAFFLLGIPVWWWFRPMPTAMAVPLPVPVMHAAMIDGDAPSNPPDFPVLMIRAGLDADALAAAGITGGTVSSIAAAVSSAMSNTPNALADADTAYATARRETDRLQRLIQSGKGSSEDVGAYQAASSALATTSATRQSVLDSVFAAGTANLTSGQRTALTNIRANRSWSLPLEFLTVNREQTEWVAVRDALANERISAKHGDDPDAGCQTQLSNWRANNTVAAAISALQGNLASVRTSWNTATGN